jgi:hypothetical protein
LISISVIARSQRSWVFAFCQKMGGNYSREFHKRSQLFVGVHNETLPIIAMRVCNPDRSPLAIHSRNTAPTPSGFAKIVSDDLPVFDAML